MKGFVKVMTYVFAIYGGVSVCMRVPQYVGLMRSGMPLTDILKANSIPRLVKQLTEKEET